MNRTFSIDYDTTLFRAVEQKKPGKFSTMSAVAIPIDNQYSLFDTVPETYYMIDYKSQGMYKFCPISGELISKVKSNTEYDQESPDAYMNVVIKYMNDVMVDASIIPLIEEMELVPTVDMFYSLPIMIYAIEGSIKNSLS